MALFGRDRGRIEPDQTQALQHPMRLRILELFIEDSSRPLRAERLARELADDFPDVKVCQVAYHLAVLRDARLAPVL